MPITSVSDDGFVPVTRSKRRQPHHNNNLKFTPKTVDDHISDLEAKALALGSSKFYSCLSTILESEKIPLCIKETAENNNKKKIHVRCLALGSPTESLNAMFQLALLNLLVDKLGIVRNQVSMWDPVFEPMDKELFEKLGYKVREEEDESVLEDTNNVILYYMIHSPPFLTEKILKQHIQLKDNDNNSSTDINPTKEEEEEDNSTSKGLEFIVIGNNLVTYSNHLTDSDLEEKYPHILGAINQVDITRQFSNLKMTSNNSSKKGKKKQATVKDVSNVLLSKELDYHEIPDNISRHEDWMTAVNDLAVYWG